MHFIPFYAPEDNDRETDRSYSQAELEQQLATQRESYESALIAEKAAREQAESALRSHEMRNMAQSALREKNLPESLMPMLDLSDEEALMGSLASAESAFRAALEDGVRARLCGTAPSAVPLEKPRKAKPLSYRQAADLYKSDRAAYDKQFGGM